MVALSPIAPGISLDALYARLDAVRVEAQNVSGKQDAFDLATLLQTVSGLATQAGLNAEAAARAKADADEIAARRAAVDAEAAVRGRADADEAGVRRAADDAEAAARAKADADEIVARRTADDALKVLVDRKLDIAAAQAVRGRDAGLYPFERPGNGYWYFTTDTGVREASDYPDLGLSNVVDSAEGRAYRITSAAHVISKQFFPVEPIETYRARFAFVRTGKPEDPNGDAIRFGLRLYDANRVLLQDVVLQEFAAPSIGLRQILTGFFSRSQIATDGVTMLPAATRSVRPYIRVFGGPQATDIEVLSWRNGGDVAPRGGPIDVPSFNTALDRKADRTEVNDAVAGKADLDSGGRVPLFQANVDLPAAGSTQPDRINLLGFANDTIRLRSRFTSGGVCTNVGANEALAEAIRTGKKLIVDCDVLCSAPFASGNVPGQLEIIAERNAKFIAQDGFPAKKLLQFIAGSPSTRILLRGLYADAQKVPVSLAGQANDTFGLFGQQSDFLLVEDCEAYAGPDFLVGGSDSGYFVTGWQNVHFKGRNKATGYIDSGLYASGGSAGDGSAQILTNFEFDILEFVNCSGGFIAKRRFQRLVGSTAIGINCGSIFVAGGEADTQSDRNTLQADDVSIGSIVGYKCTQGLIFRFARNGHCGSIIMRDMGAYIAPKTPGDASTGYSAPNVFALQLQGAERCTIGSLIADGINPETNPGRAEAVWITSRTVGTDANAEFRPSTDNTVRNINVHNLKRTIVEQDEDQARNVYEVRSVAGTAAVPVILGPGAQLIYHYATGARAEVATLHSFGGLVGQESLRVNNVSNSANFWSMSGSVTGASVALSTSGSDANVNAVFGTKGLGVLLFGAPAGNESLRVSKAASQVNAVEIVGAAAGVAPAVVARGADANVPLRVGAKGVASVFMLSPIQLPPFTFATLPSASTFAGSSVRVSDRNNRTAVSDGTNWRYGDNAIAT